MEQLLHSGTIWDRQISPQICSQGTAQESSLDLTIKEIIKNESTLHIFFFAAAAPAAVAASEAQ